MITPERGRKDFPLSVVRFAQGLADILSEVTVDGGFEKSGAVIETVTQFLNARARNRVEALLKNCAMRVAEGADSVSSSHSGFRLAAATKGEEAGRLPFAPYAEICFSSKTPPIKLCQEVVPASGVPPSLGSATGFSNVGYRVDPLACARRGTSLDLERSESC
jgi:hypothetical protein